MTETVVARRYAGALFALGKKEGVTALDAHGACLAELARLYAVEPKLAQTLKSPVITIAEKKKLLGTILEKLPADKTMYNFCYLLADKERLGALTEIARWYGILLDEANGVLRGRVVTAIKLSPGRQAELKEALKQKFGSDIELTFHVDPEILGGMVLMVGDRVMDSSLRAQLGVLRENLRRGI